MGRCQTGGRDGRRHGSAALRYHDCERHANSGYHGHGDRDRLDHDRSDVPPVVDSGLGTDNARYDARRGEHAATLARAGKRYCFDSSRYY